MAYQKNKGPDRLAVEDIPTFITQIWYEGSHTDVDVNTGEHVWHCVQQHGPPPVIIHLLERLAENAPELLIIEEQLWSRIVTCWINNSAPFAQNNPNLKCIHEINAYNDAYNIRCFDRSQHEHLIRRARDPQNAQSLSERLQQLFVQACAGGNENVVQRLIKSNKVVPNERLFRELKIQIVGRERPITWEVVIKWFQRENSELPPAEARLNSTPELFEDILDILGWN